MVRHEELVHHVGPRTAGPGEVVDVGFGLFGRTNLQLGSAWGSPSPSAHLPMLAPPSGASVAGWFVLLAFCRLFVVAALGVLVG